MDIKKFVFVITFLIVFLLSTPGISFAQSKTYSNNTAPGYQRINPPTGEFQPIPYKGMTYDPNNPNYINPNYQLPAIKKRLNLWIDLHHLGFLRDLYIVKLIFTGIASVCLGLIGLILFLRYLLFKKRLLINEGNKVFLTIKAPSTATQSAFATEQLFAFLHDHQKVEGQPFWRGLLTFSGFPVPKNTISLEIVSTKEDGIRYIIQTSKKDATVIEKTLLSYLPGAKISRISDYLPKDIKSIKDKLGKFFTISEYNLSNHFSIPLKDQKTLDHFDPIAYITGHMTKLDNGEMITMQIILTPLAQSTHDRILNTVSTLQNRIWNELVISDILHSPGIIRKHLFFPFKILFIILFFWIWIAAQVFHFIMHFFVKGEEPLLSWWPFGSKPKKVIKTPKQELLYKAISGKIDGSLFEASIRLFVSVNNRESAKERVEGFTSSLAALKNPSLQSMVPQQDFSEKLWNLLDKITNKKLFYKFIYFKLKNRLLSLHSQANPILSVSELTDIYHLPYMDTTKTEGMVKSKSSELPAPLSFKKEAVNLDVIVGKNTYGGEETPIGQTLTQRRKHTYIIGKTGMGKTEMIKNIIYQDMVNGKGLCVLDPHGDLIQDLLKIVPKERRKDVIYFDPSDREWPIGLNILSPGISFSNEEEAEERITSSIIAIFQKLTPEEYWGPRMEHILRNAALTALQTPIPTLWVLQQLLTDKDYQRKVSAKLTDPILKQFWDKEFATVGKMQMFSVTAPLTERLGLFITTKMSRHILLQESSTISIQKIMDEGKIFLVNLSKGDLGEDQSFFFGTMITSLIWMAAYQRTKIPESKRQDFFLFVDEFQNFATKRFAEISSESRKFHVSLISSHQNIAQIEDPNIIKIVAGNADTFIAMKAGPDDEKFILPFMEPEVEKGNIVNLPPYKFFMKVTNDDSEDAFSGKTELLDIRGSDKAAQEVIEYSRKHYATARKEVEAYLEKLFAGKASDQPKTAEPKGTPSKSGGIKKPKKSW
ncbi:MAG: type IV secretion system DNA-binding domain-containing protein [Candidatus Daviesbacteria bacterium]|nr:type IV secretion system DNA-binding domain-containing protein [Candidatus Daviesbacteria bacterium]